MKVVLVVVLVVMVITYKSDVCSIHCSGCASSVNSRVVLVLILRSNRTGSVPVLVVIEVVIMVVVVVEVVMVVVMNVVVVLLPIA